MAKMKDVGSIITGAGFSSVIEAMLIGTVL
jgi:hypothetical protein